jgi:hypothetical protein
MQPNPEFLHVVKDKFPASDVKLVVVSHWYHVINCAACAGNKPQTEWLSHAAAASSCPNAMVVPAPSPCKQH